MPSTKIIIVGAGYAGIMCALRLSGKSRRNHLLITVISHTDSLPEHSQLQRLVNDGRCRSKSITRFIADSDIELVISRVVALGPNANELRIACGVILTFDFLIFADNSASDLQHGFAQPRSCSFLKGSRKREIAEGACVADTLIEMLNNKSPDLNVTSGVRQTIALGMSSAAFYSEYPGDASKCRASGNLRRVLRNFDNQLDSMRLWFERHFPGLLPYTTINQQRPVLCGRSFDRLSRMLN